MPSSSLSPVTVPAHGSMVRPPPRSSHNQVLDDRNKCACKEAGCYSHAGWPASSYCGLGCIGESCLYFHIGRFQGCTSCSYTDAGTYGHLYPTRNSVQAAGCPGPLPAPTLGGANPEEERRLRTYNVDNESPLGDWTRVHSWRSPGSAGLHNQDPCGVNSGATTSFPMPFASGNGGTFGSHGSDLPPLSSKNAVWKIGSVVEASFALYANHGGGYSYRLCKPDATGKPTEACFQKTPLQFATDSTQI